MTDNTKIVDVLIIGAGPAGITASIYAIRTGRGVLVLEQLAPGGQTATTWQIDNYPGLFQIKGSELMDKMQSQAENLGVEINLDQVIEIIPGPPHKVITISKLTILAKTIIIATGAQPAKLNIPGEQEFTGRGVSYCATCDGAFFKNLPVAVIGGGNAALEEAEFLTQMVSQVYLIHRRKEFRADPMVYNNIKNNPKIKITTPYVPQKIIGDQKGVTALEIKNVLNNTKEILEVKGMFIFVGTKPQTNIFKEYINLDDNNYIKTTENLATNIPGIFAAGDCRANLLKQVVIATAEGALAAVQADKYIKSMSDNK